jgi:hypothetical protein
MKQQRPVETVEEFKLRIAVIISAKPEHIRGALRPRRAELTASRWRVRVTTLGAP